MNYIGSKNRLFDFIERTITNVVGNDLSELVFCDLFAGTGIVGRGMKHQVQQVIANDLEYYSYVLNRNYIGNSEPIKNSELLIEELNKTEPITNGFIYQNYCFGSGSGRLYFTDENGQKIDGIRTKIEDWLIDKRINKDEYFFLLASLLESADKVANTASVYGAYLKKLKSSAIKEMILKPAEFLEDGKKHLVYNEDSNKLIQKISGDILYLDPPYNARQYGANYHLLNTIARYEPFTPKGVTGLPNYNKSKYCSKVSVSNEFEDLIANANFNYIFLSYNNEGLMSEEDVRTIMEKYGNYSIKKQDYQRFRADKKANRNHKADRTEEYLHILIKDEY